MMNRKYLHILLLMGLLAGFTPGEALSQRSSSEVIVDIRNAYENLDLPVAEARITAALEMFDQFSPVELGEIYALSALIHFARDDQEGTRRQLDLALQVNPDLKLDPRDTPPQVIELLEERMRAKSASLPAETELRYLMIQDPRPAAVMRSMILPGWGQLHKKEKKKGILIMSAWGVTSIAAVTAHIKRSQAEDHYLASINVAEINDRYPAFDNWHKTRNNLFVAAAGIWVFSYVDALLNTPAQATSSPSPLQLSISPTTRSPIFQLNYKF